MEEIVIFIFRRDLRIFDNTSLNTLQKNYPKLNIIPIFIFNKNQIDKNLNKYYSSNSVQFLFESLNDLSFLNFYYSNNDISILNDIKKRFIIKAIAFNKDYTPFAINRDNEIKKWCTNNNIILISKEDYTLHKLDAILKDDNKPYLKYTPFYKKSLLKKPVAINNNKNKFNFKYDINYKSLKDFDFLKPITNSNIKVNGGRKNALDILNKLKKKYFDNYYKEREYPYLDKTTKLSAYIKYGCISIREIYYSLPINHAIVRELIWRDFYAYISFYFPHIYGKSFNKKYENIKWNYNENLFNKWKNGLTGFPLVDAGMRQLNIYGCIIELEC